MYVYFCNETFLFHPMKFVVREMYVCNGTHIRYIDKVIYLGHYIYILPFGCYNL